MYAYISRSCAPVFGLKNIYIYFFFFFFFFLVGKENCIYLGWSGRDGFACVRACVDTQEGTRLDYSSPGCDWTLVHERCPRVSIAMYICRCGVYIIKLKNQGREIFF
jgi:hypothetical protein